MSRSRLEGAVVSGLLNAGRGGWPLILVAAATALVTQCAWGQTDNVPQDRPASVSDTVTPNPAAELQAKIESLQQDAALLTDRLKTANDLEAEPRTKAEEALRRAGSEISRLQTLVTESQTFAQRAAAAQSDSESLKADIEELRQRPDPSISDQTVLAELEADLAETRQRLAELQAAEQTQRDPRSRAARRKTLRDLLVSLPAEIEQTKASLAVEPPSGEPTIVSQAVRFELRCHLATLEAQLDAARNELALYDAEDAYALAGLRGDLQREQVKNAEKEIELLSAEIGRRRRFDAQERVRQAEAMLSEASATERPLIEGPVRLGDREYLGSLQVASEEVRIRQENQRYLQRLEDVQSELEEVSRWHQQATDRIESIGPTSALGLRLRQQRELLPNTESINRRRTARLRTIEEAQNGFLDYSERIDLWADEEAVAEDFADNLTPRIEPEQLQQSAEWTAALHQRQDYLKELVEAYADYTKTLDDLDQAEQRLIDEVEQFTEFIDEHILWIRSHEGLTLESLRSDKLTLIWLLEGRFVRDLSAVVVADVVSHPGFWLLAALLLIVTAVRGRKLRRQLRAVSKTAKSRTQTSIRPTMEAWLITIVISLPWPGIMLFLAWRLSVSAGESDSIQTFSSGLAHIGVLFFVLEFFRQTCRPLGLAESHFEWPSRTILFLRRTFRGLIIFVLPAGLAVFVLHSYEAESGTDNDAIEILAFVSTMLLLLLFAHRLFRPQRGVFLDLIAFQQGGGIDRCRYLIYLTAISIPLYLIGQSILGYYYTAQKILEKSQLTVWLFLSVVFVRALLTRALMLRRRRLAMEQARQRRAAAAEAEASGDGSASNVPEVVADASADLGQISRQTQQVVNTTLVVVACAALWLVWNDVTPALNYLDNWQLWDTTTTIVEMREGGDEIAEPVARTVTVPVSIIDVAAAVLIGVLTMTAARNVPGLLEIILLERLPLDPSVRYATTAITRYLILLLGVIVTCHTLGFGWDQVQWLAAALTFGLAFGLQEIFANFVSGIIILFEQPVRVGDVVTLDSVSGVVSRIRIRSTTITDWDRKEYIVPNKEFITGRLLNWTLSDTTNRVIINVGVAYGSDTSAVLDVISRAAAEHPIVLDDPAPVVTFEAFGESSLDFVLRAYLPNLDNRLQTITELHAAIYNGLSKAGIEIPFPQRDLHLRSESLGLDRVLADPSSPDTSLRPHRA